MWPNPQIPVSLVTFTEEILTEKLHFQYSDSYKDHESTLKSFWKHTDITHL